MLRPLLAALVPFVVIVAASTESRGQGGEALSAEQRAARDQFLEDIQDELAEVKEKCGKALPVSTDFQNFDPSAEVVDKGPKKKGGPRDKDRRLRAQACSNVLDAIVRDCERTSAKGTTEVKALACLLGGHQPRNGREELSKYQHRNMSFDKSSGLLTVHYSVDGLWAAVNYTEDAVRAILHPDSKTGRFNGVACTDNSQCDSALCKASKCTACKKNGDCPSGMLCNSGTKGCYTPYEGSSSDDAPSSRSSGSSSSSSNKRSGSKRGSMCGKDKDCQSGVCKMENRTRGRCQ